MRDAIEAVLLPCPLCGAELLPDAMTATGEVTVYRHPHNACFLNGQMRGVRVPHDVDEWNRRPALTAYEAAKGGGVVEPDGIGVTDEMVEAAVAAADKQAKTRPSAGYEEWRRGLMRAALVSALTSPASGERDAVIEAEAFDDWWPRDGQYLDPDTADVPWFDKRRGLAEYAYHAGVSSAMWPDFIAPPKYENPAPEWNDPELPDFRLIWQIAHYNGYAIGLHGSMRRDCDLIAVPWVEAHSTPEALISALCSGLNAREVGIREPKPNGRLAVNIQIDGWFKLIDLSIVTAALRMEGK